MRVPRVRFTVRRLMVATAIVATACGFSRRLAHCREMAEHHRLLSYCCVLPNDAAARERMLRQVAYHGAMSRKYRLAPWLFPLPIPPDPPEIE